MQTQNLNLIVLQLVHSNVQHAMFFGCFFLNRKMSWLYLFCHTGASTQAHKIKFFMQVKLNVVFFFYKDIQFNLLFCQYLLLSFADELLFGHHSHWKNFTNQAMKSL